MTCRMGVESSSVGSTARLDPRSRRAMCLRLRAVARNLFPAQWVLARRDVSDDRTYRNNLVEVASNKLMSSGSLPRSLTCGRKMSPQVTLAPAQDTTGLDALAR